MSVDSCKLELIVMNHGDHDALLGLDWFEKTGAGLFPAEKLIRFPGKQVKLDGIGKIEDDYNKFSGIKTEENETLSDEEVLVAEVVDDFDIETDSWDFGKFKIDIGIHEGLSKEQKMKYELELYNLVKDVIATDEKSLGTCRVRQHVIDTGNAEPIYIRAYRKSLAEREILKKEVDILLQAGIIQKSTSPWSAPVNLVPKKDGSKRFCVDYRKLNPVTKIMIFPLPRVQDLLDRLAESKYFTTCDLSKGFWQMLIHPDSRPKTAFSTPDGHYEFIKLVMGLKNAPMDFTKLMEEIFADLPFILIFIDDLTIHSKTLELHFKHVRTVMIRLRDVDLKINPAKCQWIRLEIKLLGFVVSGTGVKLDPEKLAAIKDRVPPRDVKGIQKWLGICNYYRRHVKDFA